MLDDKQRAQIDQNLATMKELLPPIWMGLFVGCQDAGFNELQAFDLVKTYILSQNPNGTRP